jgi:hypothetical protein
LFSLTTPEIRRPELDRIPSRKPRLAAPPAPDLPDFGYFRGTFIWT